MFAHQTQDTIKFAPIEAAAFVQAHRVEPNLGAILFPFNVNVRRLKAIASVEEEAVRSKAENGRHIST